VAVVAVAATSDPDPGSVRAKPAIAAPRPRARQPVLLRGRAEQAHRPHAQPLHGKGKIRQPVMPRQRFADQTQRAHIQPLPRHRTAVLQPPARAQHGHQRPAGLIHIAVIHRQMRRTPRLKRDSQFAMPIFKEGPVQETRIAHLLCSKYPQGVRP
jgi:hypothetical protein